MLFIVSTSILASLTLIDGRYIQQQGFFNGWDLTRNQQKLLSKLSAKTVPAVRQQQLFRAFDLNRHPSLKKHLKERFPRFGFKIGYNKHPGQRTVSQTDPPRHSLIGYKSGVNNPAVARIKPSRKSRNHLKNVHINVLVNTQKSHLKPKSRSNIRLRHVLKGINGHGVHLSHSGQKVFLHLNSNNRQFRFSINTRKKAVLPTGQMTKITSSSHVSRKDSKGNSTRNITITTDVNTTSYHFDKTAPHSQQTHTNTNGNKPVKVPMTSRQRYDKAWGEMTEPTFGIPVMVTTEEPDTPDHTELPDMKEKNESSER